MIDRIRIAAIGLVLAAAAGAAYQLSLRDPADPQRTPPGHTPQPAAPVSRADAVRLWTDDILERPLINPGRRAPSPGVAMSAEPPPEPMPRLTGVIVGPTKRMAIFVSAPDARSVVLQEGAHVGRYVIRAIRSNEVVLDGADGPRTLRPVHDGQPASNELAPVLPKRAGLAPSLGWARASHKAAQA